MMTRTPYLPLLAATWLIVACGYSGTEPPDGGDGDRIVQGVNLTALFAPPSDAEIEAVGTEWEGRDPAALQVQEEAAFPLDPSSLPGLGGGPKTLRILSHEVDGLRHVGGVISPDGAPAGSLPVLVYAHGGDAGTSLELDLGLVLSALGDRVDDFVIVAPAFRSEPFDARPLTNASFTAEGEPSPWDRDVDDALALVEAAVQTTPSADPDSVFVVGLSRGGGVGLLMSIRDPQIDGVVTFFGPTDFFSTWVEDILADILLNQPPDLPGVDALTAQIADPLEQGTLDIDGGRLELVRRSPVLFAERLARTQLHHGTADQVVPVSQAEALISAVDDLGPAAPAFEPFIYPGGGHNVLTLSGSVDRTLQFLAGMAASVVQGSTAGGGNLVAGTDAR